MAKRKRGYYQTGRSSRKADSQKRAKAPGKRLSKSKKVYYERRKNRSDKPGTLLGVPVKLLKYPKRPKAGATTKQLEKYLDRVKAIDSENTRRKELATSISKRLSKKK
jgi:hypothetical protein